MTPAKKVLTLHRNGQWCKKVLGKLYYFGTDYGTAVDEWLKCKDSLLAGRGKPVESDEPTITQLANLYYDACRAKIEAGDFSIRSLAESKNTLLRLIELRGEDDQPSIWGPMDFKEIKSQLFEPVARSTPGRKVDGKNGKRSPSTVNGDVRRIKAFLNWCSAQKYIPRSDYGTEFSESSARLIRISKARAGKRTFEPKDLKKIIESANRYFLPVILLGINGGMGAKDISLLTLDQILPIVKSKSEWLECHRNKTGAPRKIWLWPETRKAIKSYLSSVREDPFSDQFDDIAFLTSHRTPWVKESSDGRQDAATQMFTKLRKECKVKSGTFYDLRRTFQTTGEETLDFPAVSFCMGHIPGTGDMSAKYREVSDERVKKVCEIVRDWLYCRKKAQV
jgi:integrase